MTIKVHIVPTIENMPVRGGVREHLRLLHREARTHPKIEVVDRTSSDALVHVESAYPPPRDRIDVYVCHGGFTPNPLRVVMENLGKAKIVISVSKWIAKKYFPNLMYKTVVIPNGIDLSEWSYYKIGAETSVKNYTLYAKEGPYYFSDFLRLVSTYPKHSFVSLVWPLNIPKPSNVTVIGLQSRNSIRKWICNARLLILTGTEVCPIMLLEAWACGVPVLAQNTPPTRAAELMTVDSRVVGGALYTSNDFLQMFDFWHTSSLELGAQGFAEVQKYQWKNLFEQYISVYEL